MARLICALCGVEFVGVTHKRKDKHNPNQRLIDDANRATELGLSYGVYMGGTYAHKRL